MRLPLSGRVPFRLQVDGWGTHAIGRRNRSDKLVIRAGKIPERNDKNDKALCMSMERLGIWDTINAGRSMAFVVIAIVMIPVICFEIADSELLTEYSCPLGDTIPGYYVGDGGEDCWNGADESPEAEATEIFLIPDLIRGVGVTIMIMGFLGLTTKVIADGISAGLSLHHRDTEGSDNSQPPIS